jgi:hypothetical protein
MSEGRLSRMERRISRKGLKEGKKEEFQGRKE